MISLYFSAISFFSSWFLVQKINRLFEGVQPAAILSFLFFPSVVFWSAGVIKECLAMAALFFLSLIFLKVWKREKLRWTEWLLIVTSLWIVWSLKYYYLAIFLPVVFTTLAFQYLLSKFTLKSLAQQGDALVFDIYDSDSPDKSSSSEFLLRKIYGSCGFQLL